MTIICYVAADFVNSEGEKFSVTGRELGVIKEAPEWIKGTLLFRGLVKDGSLKFVTKENVLKAENEPMAGISAEGKEVREEPVDVKTEISTQPKKRTTRKKTEKKDDA